MSPADKPDDRVHVELQPGTECLRCHEVALENDRTRISVGEIVIPDRGDRYVQLHRIDIGSENTGFAAAIDRLRGADTLLRNAELTQLRHDMDLMERQEDC